MLDQLIGVVLAGCTNQIRVLEKWTEQARYTSSPFILCRCIARARTYWPCIHKCYNVFPGITM